jgi:acetylcholinesterase
MVQSQVILFGQSAGAISTSYQSLYNGGKIGGVFRGMIMESGSPASFVFNLINIRAILITSLRVNVPNANDPVQEAAYSFLVNATGCTNSSNTFECLRSAPADVLQQANQNVIKVSNM